jgi:Fe-S cluster assembly protein SufD
MKKHEINNSTNKVDILKNTYKFLDQEDTIYEVEENEVLTIIDIMDTNIDVKRELIVNENATLNYVKIGKSENSSNVKFVNTIKNNATLNMSLFEFGSSQNSVETKLKNENSNFTINGLLDLKEDAKVEYTVTTNHQTKSFSDIAFKNLLSGKSSATLNMFSIVENTAAFSKAFQNSKTILLSDDSSVTVTPHLEISIDELEASHGVTCGDLDRDSIYYLESRGIKEDDAKIMLLNAIRNEVYSSLQNEELVEYLKGLL